MNAELQNIDEMIEAAKAGVMQQGPMITKEITYLSLAVAVRPSQDGSGGKELVFLDAQTGTAHIFPFPPDGAKMIAAKLGSDLTIPEQNLVVPGQ